LNHDDPKGKKVRRDKKKKVGALHDASEGTIKVEWINLKPLVNRDALLQPCTKASHSRVNYQTLEAPPLEVTKNKQAMGAAPVSQQINIVRKDGAL